MIQRRYAWRVLVVMVLALLIVSACNAWRAHAPAVQSNAQGTAAAQQPSTQATRSVEAKNNADKNNNSIAYGQLPIEARNVIDTIKARGQFPYSKDGSVFGNREKLLPYQPKGYYREYTVITPNSSDRGARRIIAGQGSTGDVASSGEYYYTQDHYRSFKKVKP